MPREFLTLLEGMSWGATLEYVRVQSVHIFSTFQQQSMVETEKHAHKEKLYWDVLEARRVLVLCHTCAIGCCCSFLKENIFRNVRPVPSPACIGETTLCTALRRAVFDACGPMHHQQYILADETQRDIMSIVLKYITNASWCTLTTFP